VAAEAKWLAPMAGHPWRPGPGEGLGRAHWRRNL